MFRTIKISLIIAFLCNYSGYATVIDFQYLQKKNQNLYLLGESRFQSDQQAILQATIMAYLTHQSPFPTTILLENNKTYRHFIIEKDSKEEYNDLVSSLRQIFPHYSYNYPEIQNELADAVSSALTKSLPTTKLAYDFIYNAVQKILAAYPEQNTNCVCPIELYLDIIKQLENKRYTPAITAYKIIDIDSRIIYSQAIKLFSLLINKSTTPIMQAAYLTKLDKFTYTFDDLEKELLQLLEYVDKLSEKFASESKIQDFFSTLKEQATTRFTDATKILETKFSINTSTQILLAMQKMQKSNTSEKMELIIKIDALLSKAFSSILELKALTIIIPKLKLLTQHNIVFWAGKEHSDLLRILCHNGLNFYEIQDEPIDETEIIDDLEDSDSENETEDENEDIDNDEDTSTSNNLETELENTNPNQATDFELEEIDSYDINYNIIDSILNPSDPE